MKSLVLSAATSIILSLTVGVADAKDKIDHLLEITSPGTCLSIRPLTPRGLFASTYFKPILGSECFGGGLGGSSLKTFSKAITHEMQQVGLTATMVLAAGSQWELETADLPDLDLDEATVKAVDKWLRKNGGLAMYRNNLHQKVLVTYGKGERLNNAEHALIQKDTYTGASMREVFAQAFPSQ